MEVVGLGMTMFSPIIILGCITLGMRSEGCNEEESGYEAMSKPV